jgi:hypothetical protein
MPRHKHEGQVNGTIHLILCEDAAEGFPNVPMIELQLGGGGPGRLPINANYTLNIRLSIQPIE